LDVRTTDWHTAGAPFRIVTSGTPEIPGSTVLERRERAVRRRSTRFPCGRDPLGTGFVLR